VTLTQPLTHLLKINEAHNIASAEQRGTQADLRKAEAEIVFAVHKLYYGLLAEKKLREAALAGVAASEEALSESKRGVESGAFLDIAETGSRVRLLQNKQALLATEIRISDLNAELNDLLGLPLDTELIPAGVRPFATGWRPRDVYVKEALSRNPEIMAAQETVKKADSAVNASYYEFIPEIGAFGRYTHQDGVPFVTNNMGIFGLQLKWNIFEWGKRKSVVGQRKAQLMQAKENLRRMEKRVEVDVDKAYRKLDQTKMMVDVAREELALQRENLRLSGNRQKAGTITAAQYAELVASVKKSEYNELQARLGFELALADLDRVAGVSLNR
jgi:outer membrane protein TolC